MATDSNQGQVSHWGIEPLPPEHRHFRAIDLAVLWGDLGVGLLVLVSGALLVPALSLPKAFAAIVIGSIAGCFLLALGGLAGAREGVPTMVLLRPLLGRQGSWIATILNTIQLLGWTAFELWAMASVASVVSKRLFGTGGFGVWLVVSALLVAGLAIWGPLGVVRRWMQRFGVWVVVAIGCLITIALWRKGLGEVWERPGKGGLSFAIALDLVIAMPVSWLPLVADYNRFAIRESASFKGTFAGYFVANVWFYGLGALLLLQGQGAAPTPEGMAAGILAVGGIALSGALLLAGLVAGEADEAFANVYSASMSIRNIFPRASGRMLVIGVTVAGALGAATLSMDRYEMFLFLIGSVFVPLFGAWIAHYFVLSKAHHGRYIELGGDRLRPLSLLPWVAGFLVYHWIAPVGPEWWQAAVRNISDTPVSMKVSWVGASVPAFATAFVLQMFVGGRSKQRLPATERTSPS